MASISHSVSQKIHGSGIANCSSSPTITSKFTITFTRNEGSSTVSWKVTGSKTTHSDSYYGYQIWSYIAVNDGSKQKIASKEVNDKNWSKLNAYNPTGSFTSTSSTTTVKFYVKSRKNCMHSNKYCFNASGTYTHIKTLTLSIPTYETPYTATYDANSDGAPVSNLPGPASFSNIHPLTIAAGPTFEIANTYYTSKPASSSTNLSAPREFLHWNTQADDTGTSYSPGDSYNTAGNVTFYAQWGNATFQWGSTIAEPDEHYVTITYNYGDSSLIPTYPASVAKPAEKLGYTENSSPSATVPDYRYNQDNIVTDTGLTLYAVYGNATLLVSEMPVPVRSGYMFKGWFYDSACTQPIVTQLETPVDTTIYAKWKPYPTHKYDPNKPGWENGSQYVWRYHADIGQWVKEAHVFQYDDNQGTWEDLSE
jgi:uncharacterized repeat protein (TIGR02543 family)